MDVNLFQQALLHTFSPDVTQRHAAEQVLSQYRAHPEYYPALVHVAVSQDDFPREVRQAAAIALKNAIKQSWQALERAQSDNKPVPPEAFSNEVKPRVREQCLAGLLRERDTAVRTLLAEIVNNLIHYDYPAQWPQLLEAIMAGVEQGSDVVMMHNALLALRKLTKKFEYKGKKEREPLDNVIRRSFPTLQPLMQNLVQNHNSIEAAEVLKLNLKIFWSCTQFQLPACLDSDTLMAWLNLTCILLHKPLPEGHEGKEPAGQPADPEERKRWPWWKVKKWSCVIVTRFAQRYGQPRYATEQTRAFAKLFYHKMAVQLLEPMVELMCLRAKGQFCTDRVLQLSLEYVSASLENAPTYQRLKPNLENILFQVVFPMLFPRDEDVRLFDEDPIDYIRKGGSCEVEEFYDPKDSALGLLKEAVEKRGKTLLPRLLQFLHSILVAYQQNPHQPGADFRAKDAALLVLGSLCEELKSPKKPYHSQLQDLLLTHVLPEFKSSVGMMRSRACWMMRHFHDIQFSDPSVLRVALESVLQCLCDPCLPVRVEAATSIRELALLPGTEEVFVPHLAALLQQYFMIMNEVGSDEVVQALDMIIDRFDRYMVPHAQAMAEQLCKTFFQYASEGDQDDDKALAASQCLDALNTLLQSVRDHKPILASCEQHVLPVLALVLGPDGDYYEYLESALDLLTCLTFYSSSISPQLWALFPLIYQVFNRWAYDYLQNMVSPIDNFVHKGTDVFLAGHAADGTRYVDMVLNMVGKVLRDDRGDYREACRALLLIKSVIYSCKGRLDPLLPPILTLVVQRLSLQLAPSTNSTGKGSHKLRRPPKRLTTALLATIGLCLHANAPLTLQVLESNNWTQHVFGAWFQVFDDFKQYSLHKQVILGLMTMLSLPPDSLPPCIRGNVGLILSRLVPLLEATAEWQEDEEANGGYERDDEEYDDDDDEEEDSDEDAGVEEGEDGDVVSKKDEKYMRALQRLQKEKDEDDDGLVDSDEEEEDEEEEEDFITTTIAHVDEVAFFHSVLAQAFGRETGGGPFTSVHQAMDPALKQRFETMYNKGKERLEAEQRRKEEFAQSLPNGSMLPAAHLPPSAHLGHS